MLNIDPIVKVNVQVGNNTASSGTFNVGMILTPTAGTGTPLSKSNRYAVYDSLMEVLSGVESSKPAFAATTDVYKAASKYFGVDNAPAQLVVVFYETDPDAEPYNPAGDYEVGDYCTHGENDGLYVCNTDITGGEAWNASHWDEVTRTEDTPAAALMDAISKGAEFYGVYFSPKASATDGEIKLDLFSIISAMDSMNRGVVFYGVSGSVPTITGAGSILAEMQAAGSKRAVGMYCTSDLDDAAGLMGTAMGLARNSDTSAFALCYKGIASAAVNNITQSDVNDIKAVNGNVFVQRTRSKACIENGATASGLRFDEVLFIDRMAFDIQTGIYDLIAGSATKYPQNDTTSAIFLNEIFTILETYYRIGVLATAMWRGLPIMGVETGDVVEHGHMELVESYDLQTQADRDAHKAMPITILLCLSGSVETIAITVDVQA